MDSYTGVKVFSATKALEREGIGPKITKWIADNPTVEIVDTVGAGDTFCAGFVAWWVQRSTHSEVHRDTLGDLDLVAAAATAGVHASVIAVGRRGADPPYREELSADLWG